MTDSESASGGRPTAVSTEELYEHLEGCEPYTVTELEGEFEAGRETIRNRLEELTEDGRLLKKKHSSRVTTYRIPH
ncbi:hypothetical protein [Haloarcula sp. H-GB5]|jgi:DeoR/GlpR family transcriptional regulator of sugar metabolism